VSASDDDSTSNELVLIRRRANADDAPSKGGVWKIAYADFMTAMMAFFLVMWLINATDKKVITQVANYFNPLRLTDKVPTEKGLHDVDPSARGKETAQGNSKEKDGRAKGDYAAEAGKPKYTEEMLFQDPYGILTKLAKEAADEKRLRGEAAQSPGPAFRDPFDPAFRHEAVKDAAALKGGKSKQDGAAKAAGRKVSAAAPVAAKEEAPPAARTAAEEVPAAKPPVAPVPPSAPAKPADAAAQPQKPETKEAALTTPDKKVTVQSEAEKKEALEAKQHAERVEAAKADAAKLETDIKGALQRALAGTLPNVDVTVVEDGVLISLTDAYNFGMFAIASAEPRPATVVIMENIAKILAQRSEPLIVRGHTDGRPYRSQNYDNWRLSTARAHMAYYMLVRGGVDEKRFERIEGYADRQLKVPDSPEAAQNRRIEILLRKSMR
jgi:chemotaxis protein MotB